MTRKQKTALVTGAAGFIGYHVSKQLLEAGWRVIGIDCMSDYYDVSLKKKRESMLLRYPNYNSVRKRIEEPGTLKALFVEEKPDVIVHLAAQAGVRYSIENPRSYLESNITGTFELLEAARAYQPKHMLFASTSSAYGASERMPNKETDKADHQMSFYAATKKSTENMAHSYSHLFGMPITIFRFFTVYGPWGRPDMALFKFTKAILSGDPIDVYNYGNMSRDFTFIDDLVTSVTMLIDVIPNSAFVGKDGVDSIDSKSPVAPFRVVNIGNSKPQSLNAYIQALEKCLGLSARRNLLPMQAGDVEATWADTELLTTLTGKRPETDINEGISRFVKWYKNYYGV